MPDPGSRIGRHVIRTRLGVGGMGEVYRTRDETRAQDVTLGVLPAGRTDQEHE